MESGTRAIGMATCSCVRETIYENSSRSHDAKVNLICNSGSLSTGKCESVLSIIVYSTRHSSLSIGSKRDREEMRYRPHCALTYIYVKSEE